MLKSQIKKLPTSQTQPWLWNQLSQEIRKGKS